MNRLRVICWIPSNKSLFFSPLLIFVCLYVFARVLCCVCVNFSFILTWLWSAVLFASNLDSKSPCLFYFPLIIPPTHQHTSSDDSLPFIIFLCVCLCLLSIARDLKQAFLFYLLQHKSLLFVFIFFTLRFNTFFSCVFVSRNLLLLFIFLISLTQTARAKIFVMCSPTPIGAYTFDYSVFPTE